DEHINRGACEHEAAKQHSKGRRFFRQQPIETSRSLLCNGTHDQSPFSLDRDFSIASERSECRHKDSRGEAIRRYKSGIKILLWVKRGTFTHLWPMSALGQKQTWEDVKAMSALPPKADIGLSREMSALYQKQTHAPQQNACSLDTLSASNST